MAAPRGTLKQAGDITTVESKAREAEILKQPERQSSVIDEKDSGGQLSLFDSITPIEAEGSVDPSPEFESNINDGFNVTQGTDLDTGIEDTTTADQDAAMARERQEQINLTSPKAAIEYAERNTQEGLWEAGDDPASAMESFVPKNQHWDVHNNLTNRSREQRRITTEAADTINDTSSELDGGIFERAANLAAHVESRNIGLDGLTDASNSVVKNALTAVGAINPETKQPDRDFLQIASIVAEDAFATLSMEDGIAYADLDPQMQDDTNIVIGRNKKGNQITKIVPKSQGRREIGRRVHQHYQKIKGNEDYKDLSPQDAETIGDIVKELYFAANDSASNPIIEMVRIPSKSKGDKWQRGFRITPYGEQVLSAGADIRSVMFPKQQVRTSKNPLPKGRLTGDPGRNLKRVSGAMKPVVGAELMNEAAENASTVGNLVIPRRLKILFATAIPVLSEVVGNLIVQRDNSGNIRFTIKDDFGLSDLNHVGQDTINVFVGRARMKGLKDQALIDYVKENHALLINKLAQDVFGVNLERKGANFFTYYIQAFSGRISDPQQNTLNPTRSKTARFVTGNPAPSIVSNKGTFGIRVHKNLRQMYANELVDGAADLLPEERENALQANETKLYEWGKKLREAMDTISDADVQTVSEAIDNNVPLMIDGRVNENFPKFPKWSSVLANESDLAKAIRKKGEDGQVFIDGLIDFANYIDARNKKDSEGNWQFHTHFNSMMDGKTSGLSINGLQLGNEIMAFRTGVLRTQGKYFLDNNKDIRDELKDNLINLVNNEPWKGLKLGSGENSRASIVLLKKIARIIYANRDLNKQTTMTFPYGRELESFKRDIEPTLHILSEESRVQKDEDQKSGNLKKEYLFELLDEFMKLSGMNTTFIVDALHKRYVDGLVQTLSPEFQESRSLMRSVAGMAAMYNEPMSLISATGFELNLGGSMTTGFDTRQQYKIWVPVKGSDNSINIYYGTDENAVLSNLAARPFKDKEGRLYQSVEHAYQTWKSGKFDEVTYNKKWLHGTKHEGLFKVDKEKSSNLMELMIRASFEQNPDAMEALLDTRGSELTHTQDKGFWGTEFPRILMDIRDGVPIDPSKKTNTGGYKHRSISRYDEQPTAAFPKRREVDLKDEPWDESGQGTRIDETPGDVAYGGSVPSPIHSLDAATVIKVLTGKSWDELVGKSRGNPYIHTVYDAFKVDAMSYDVVLKEANRNWYEVNRKWSYLKAARDSFYESKRNFKDKWKNTSDDTVLTNPNDTLMMSYFAEWDFEQDGFVNLENKLSKYTNEQKDVKNEKGKDQWIKRVRARGELKRLLETIRRREAFNKEEWTGNLQTVTLGELKEFNKLMEEIIGLPERLTNFINKTEADKEKLFKKIDAAIKAGNLIYQYYSH